MDILYCPYWFDGKFKEEASLSFPSKLTTYLAAGPTGIFHSPKYASPAIFLEENQAAMQCNSLVNSEIFNKLDRLVADDELYTTIAKNGSGSFSQASYSDEHEEKFCRISRGRS